MEPDINSAIKHGFLQQVRFLVEYGHSINKRDEDQRTPLMNCALIHNENWGAGLVRLFIEKGANISLRDKLGLNALHYACIYGRSQIVDIYLNALDFNINAVDRYGNTPLHYAAVSGNMNVTRAMANCCKKYGLSVDKANKKGETPLALAWKSGYYDCGNMLIHIAGADADIEDNEGKSARDWLHGSEPKSHNGIAPLRPVTANTRQRKALGNIQVASLSLTSQSRPTTALTGAKQRPYTAVRQQSLDKVKRSFSLESKQENYMDNIVPDKVKQISSHCYIPASNNDHRNNPQYIFQISPAQYFSNRDVNANTFPLASCHSARLLKTRKEDPVNSSWRNAVKQYFTSYDYQFAHSYRKPAVAPEPEPEEVPAEDRAESPVPSEMGESDLSSVHGKKGSKSKDKQDKRKISQAEKHDGKGLGRKISTLAPPSRNDGGQFIDSSSSESINGKRGDRIKSARPGSRDGNQSRMAMKK